MGKLYEEYFHVPEDGKISEKVMMMRVALTVITIVFCLAAMGISAYAFFSHEVTSSSNIISAANFETNVQIKTESSEDVAVIGNSQMQTAELKAGETYTITIKPKEGTTAQTGFAILSVEGNELSRCHTQQLGRDGNIITDAITFYVTAIEDVKVKFLAHWGTSSYYMHPDETPYVTDGESIGVSSEGIFCSHDTSDIGDKEEVVDPDVTTPAVIEHLIVYGDSLSNIAVKYNTTVERLAEYNGIEDRRTIRAGKTLKIPPDDWEMPEEETTVTETTKVEETTVVPEESQQDPVDTTETTQAITETTQTEEEPNEDIIVETTEETV